MSNLGFKKFCEENEINFVATTVGDRYVLENMMANNYIIGGEQSGHIIFRNLANTGDGELTALQILNIMSISNKPLSELASVMQKYPQVLINVNVSKEGKDNYSSDEEINKIISEIENDLGTDGRVLVRASGTENLVRVMIEGLNIDDITAKANAIADLIKQKYGV
jgi:phosphoglucosamine mutase